MYQFNLSYRHDNGEIEGFTGTGSTKKSAEQDAIRKAKAKAEAIRATFNPSQLVLGKKCLRPGELKVVQADWRISACSNTI